MKGTYNSLKCLTNNNRHMSGHLNRECVYNLSKKFIKKDKKSIKLKLFEWRAAT